MKLSTTLWLFLAAVLFINTFSFKFLFLIFSSVTFIIIGCFTSLYLNQWIVHQDYLILNHSGPIQLVQDDDFDLKRYLSSSIKSVEESDCDDDLTGACFTGKKVIDDQIHDVLRLAFRDYINSWYCHISPHKQFIHELKSHSQMVIKLFAERCDGMNVVSFMTTKLVDDFASHLRLYRLAQTQMQQLKVEDPNANLLSIFFDLEVKMEKNVCRDLVSEDNESCNVYLSHVCDILEYFLLPGDSFKNRPLRSLFRSIFVKSFLLPILELLSDPDYINQTIIWLCKSYVVSSDTFLTVLRSCNSSDELEAVNEIVNNEIYVLRSKDTGENDFEIKQQISSLLFVKSIIESRMKCLNDGVIIDNEVNTIPTQIDWKNIKLFSLPFDVVLKNSCALSYFIEFMSSIGAQGYIYFYLNIEAFKVTAEQQLSEIQLSKLGKPSTNHSIDLDSLKEAAINIYDTYLSEKANHKLQIEEIICKKIFGRIITEKLSDTWFDEAQIRVYDIMMNNENFFPSFKKTNHYIKLLADLDLLKDANEKPDEENEEVYGLKSADNWSTNYDSDSLNSFDEAISNSESIFANSESLSIASDTSSISSSSGISSMKTESTGNGEFSAEIIKCGIIREFGNAYAAYVINVIKDNEKWTILRRYSDFFSLHKFIFERFQEAKDIPLPGKRTFNNMSKDFVEQRRHLLNAYLSQLLKQSTSCQGLKEHLEKFLKPGNYEKEKFMLARTVKNSIFNPIKSSVLSVGNVVKSGSENLFDGLQKLSKIATSTNSNLHVPTIPLSGDSKTLPQIVAKQIDCLKAEENLKVSANLDVESEDNIPLRIVLLLMDEMFDLKSQNFWLRRRLVVFLRQIIQATFGGAINKKIIDFVEDLTSASSIAEYIKAFKNSFWSNNPYQQERNYNIKMRTKIAAKILLLSSFSDDLKHIIGNETTRKGLLFMFEMFQHEHLNRRFLLVLFEGLLQELFPHNNLKEMLQKLHSKSQRIQESEPNSWPPFLYKILENEIRKSPSKSPLSK